MVLVLMIPLVSFGQGGMKIKAGTNVKMVGANVHVVLDDGGVNGDGTLTIESGATLDVDGLLKLDGDLVNQGTLNQGNSNIAFSGSFDQSVEGTHDFFDISLEKPGGVLDLMNPFSVTNQLNLTSGSVTNTGVNVLTVETTATIAGGSATSFIDGQLEIFTSASSGIQLLNFPVGKSGEFRPLDIELNQSNNTSTGYTVEYFSTAQTGPVDASITFPQPGFWTIDNGAASNFSAPLVSLPFTSAGVSIGEKVLVLQDLGGGWQSLGGQYFTAGLDSVYNAINFTQWGDFTVGVTPGSSYTIKCWIGETVKVPND